MEICMRMARFSENLKEHKDSVHLELKIFVCDWVGIDCFKCSPPGCEEQFSKKCQLKVHTIKYHTNDKPHKCDQCTYETTYRALLLRHKRIHGPEKALKCDWPDKDIISKLIHLNIPVSDHSVVSKWDAIEGLHRDKP
ncbi:unnamed protein product [Oppiella nova]|uniref:C2H2-type domain-containing protein n=1 Tax=Oppiella nova TaxID=334625 RepID=A0A7R9MCC9_9ACAR|nr:unnamed protein product [Oppiella nova]CAG2174727.1 unnamed protein product [Oppiella nova]